VSAVTVDAPAGITTRRRNPWPAFVGRRVLRLVTGIVVVVTASFLVMQLVPGDPVRLSLGPSAPLSLVKQRRADLGLDDSLIVQYLNYWKGVFTGNFGTSILTQQSVTSIIASRIWNTVTLVAIALGLTLFLAVAIGVTVGGLAHNGRRPRLLAAYRIVASTLNVVPEYLYGVALVVIFAVTLKLLPVAGDDGFKSLILPSLAISLAPIAGLSRIVRVQTEEVLSQEYIQFARSKRLPGFRIYWRHALPNLLTSALTVGGILLGVLVASTVIVENVFALPGLGSTVVTAITQRDYPLAQGVLLILGGSVVLVNLIIDVIVSLLDPRSLMRDS
jgi:peptide/nickel transport system permease protein